MNENWSIKLLVGDGGVPNYNEWELVYKPPSTQEKYKLSQLGSITGQAPVILPHISDAENPVPARAVEGNKQGRWEIEIFDDENDPPEWDTILNNIHVLNRHLSGASSTAVRNAISGTAEEARIAILPDGATNTTYFTVQWGVVDVSATYYKPESQQGSDSVAEIGAWFIPITLTFDPGGKGDPFTLRNDLLSSPHFIEDSNADGVADGWGILGASSPTIDTTRYLVGGKSQRLSVDSSTNFSGIRSSVVAAPISSTATASVWLSADSTGNDTIAVALVDGTSSGSVSVSFHPSNPVGFDGMKTGSDGSVWYRYSVTKINTGAANFRLIVWRPTASQATVFYVDATYLNVGNTQATAGWCSSSSLKNRYDPNNTNESTRQQINYLDVWDIPGDLPAILKSNIEYTSTDAESLTLSKRVLDSTPPAGVPHFFDSSDFDSGATNYTIVVDATRIGGSYLSCPAGAALNRTNFVTFPSSGEPDFMNSTLRCFLFIRTTHADASAAVRVSDGANSILIEDIKPAAINTWSLVDAGRFNVGGLAADVSTIESWSFDVQLRATGTSGTVHLDGVYFFPTFELLQTPLDLLNTNGITIRNGKVPETFTIGDDGQYKKQNTQGSMDELIPSVENRLIITSRGDVNTSAIEVHDIDTEFEVTLTVTPRASHLLGTQ